jgi:hypothetical protein
VASTIIGVTSLAQLDEDLDAWGTVLSPELLARRSTASAGNCATRRSVLALPRIYINGGRRGYLVGIDPAVLSGPLGATAVDCALN